jgi:hypothetical protein
MCQHSGVTVFISPGTDFLVDDEECADYDEGLEQRQRDCVKIILKYFVREYSLLTPK